MKKFSILLILALVFAGCEDFFISEVDNVKIPGSTPQLVVNSYISPQDTIIKVFVNRSIPYTQDPRDHRDVLGNADVFIGLKGAELLKLEYFQQCNCFVLNASLLNVQAGNYYELKVETHDGERAEAECFVPEFQIADFNYLKPYTTSDQWSEYKNIEWSFIVNAEGGEQYFRTGAYIYHVDYYEIEGEIYFNEGYYDNLWLDRGSPYVIDNKGSSYSFRAQQWINQNDYNYPIVSDPSSPNYSQIKKESIFVYVIQSDFNYYRFHKSVDDYFYYDDGFPFAESVHIYSNIEGALGTFGGYNKKVFYIPN